MQLIRKAASTCCGLAAAFISTSSLAQYTPYFSMTGMTWVDETSFWLEGARIVGLGLGLNDEVKAKFAFRSTDASFVLVDSKVIPGAGVVYRDAGFTSRDVEPRVPSYSVAGQNYSSNAQSWPFNATSATPFVASANLKIGHVLSFMLEAPTSDYTYELLGPSGTTESAYDGSAGSTVISGAYRITADGTYILRIKPRGNSTQMSFKLALLNANNRLLQTLGAGAFITTSFVTNQRDYYKATIRLNAGQRISLPKPLNSNVQLCILDAYSREKTCATGLPISFKVMESGDYYVFIYNVMGWGGSYSGTVQITQEAMAFVSGQVSAPPVQASERSRFGPAKPD